jgi:UDP-N-acetylglucosamine 2-epimerase (non-hydrolysing)
MAPIHRKMKAASVCFNPVLIHTGQHYDQNMSANFFRDLNLPEPDLYMGVGPGSHAEQTAKLMVGLEKAFIDLKPDIVVVVGDVNSTMAAAITAAKMCIPVAHVEAGLRSFDRTMPEEINRIVTDSLSNLMFVTEESGLRNLIHEGFDTSKIHFVGNVMIDSLVEHLESAEKTNLPSQLNLKPKSYILTTLHRPSNVDHKGNMTVILDAFEEISKSRQIVFPVHPRTRKMLNIFGFDSRIGRMKNLVLLEPVSYLPFLKLIRYADAVITDSGGIQEETTFLKIPCLTLRPNTERPVTVEMGTNRLLPIEARAIVDCLADFSTKRNSYRIPPMWDGHATDRIIEIINNFY